MSGHNVSPNTSVVEHFGTIVRCPTVISSSVYTVQYMTSPVTRLHFGHTPVSNPLPHLLSMVCGMFFKGGADMQFYWLLNLGLIFVGCSVVSAEIKVKFQ